MNSIHFMIPRIGLYETTTQYTIMCQHTLITPALFSFDDIEQIESYLILSIMERYHKKGFIILKCNKFNVTKEIEFATYQLELE